MDLTAAGLHKGSVLYLEVGARPASDSVLLNLMLVSGNNTEVKYAIEESGVRGAEVELTVLLTDTLESVRDRAGVLLLGYTPGWTQRCQALTTGTGLRNHLEEELQPLPILSDAVDIAGPAEVALAAATTDSKVTALEEFGAGFTGRRLRRTSWLKEPADLLSEQVEDVSTNASTSAPRSTTTTLPEGIPLIPAVSDGTTVAHSAYTALTVKDAALKSGDTLLLEEGLYPVKGQLGIKVLAM